MKAYSAYHIDQAAQCKLYVAGYALSGKVNGVAAAMQAHLKKCPNMTAAQKALAGMPAATCDTSGTVASSQSQSKLNRFLSVQDTPHSRPEQSRLEQLILRATISGNLPFSWVQDEHVMDLFRFLKPSIDIPDRRKLAGQPMLCCMSQVHIIFSKTWQC